MIDLDMMESYLNLCWNEQPVPQLTPIHWSPAMKLKPRTVQYSFLSNEK